MQLYLFGFLSPDVASEFRPYLHHRPPTYLPLSPISPLPNRSHNPLLPSMNTNLFLPCIPPDLAWVCHPFSACLLYPLVHFILILKKPIAAKDISPSKRSG